MCITFHCNIFQIDIFQTAEPLADFYTLMDIAYIYTWTRVSTYFSNDALKGGLCIPYPFNYLEKISDIPKMNMANIQKKSESIASPYP